MPRYEAVVIGCSAGGMKALKEVLAILTVQFPIPILIVQHLPKGSNHYMIESFNRSTHLSVKEADEKEKPVPGFVYIAPPDYHLLIDDSGAMVLSVDPPVNYSRPSIDELFISAAEYYGQNLISIILTGANDDGVLGTKKVVEFGGTAIVQDPSTAESTMMPQSVIDQVEVDYILTLPEISEKMIGLTA